jgi:hypothetical protein
MSAPFRLLTLHPWWRPNHGSALEWLDALGGRQAPLGGEVGASVSEEIVRGLRLGRDLAQRPSPFPGPTHIQLLDASVAMMAAVSAALPGLAVEGAAVVVSLSGAGFNAVLTPFGAEVTAKFAGDLQACGADRPRFVTGSAQACDRLQAAGWSTLRTPALPRGSSSRANRATPSEWRAVLEGLTLDRPAPTWARVG